MLSIHGVNAATAKQLVANECLLLSDCGSEDKAVIYYSEDRGNTINTVRLDMPASQPGVLFKLANDAVAMSTYGASRHELYFNPDRGRGEWIKSTSALTDISGCASTPSGNILCTVSGSSASKRATAYISEDGGKNIYQRWNAASWCGISASSADIR